MIIYTYIYIILYEISKLSISSTIEHGMNFLLRSPNSPGFSPGAVARCDGAWHRRRKSSNWKTVARSPWIGGTLSIDLLRPRCPPIRIVFCWPTWTWWKLRFMGIWLKTWIYIYIYVTIYDYIWLYFIGFRSLLLTGGLHLVGGLLYFNLYNICLLTYCAVWVCVGYATLT